MAGFSVIQAISAYNALVNGPSVPKKLQYLGTLFIIFLIPILAAHKLRPCFTDNCAIIDYFDLERSISGDFFTEISKNNGAIIDNITIIFIALLISIFVQKFLQIEILNDALTPLRKVLLGDWTIHLLEFADSGNTHFIIPLKISLTNDQKLYLSPQGGNLKDISLENPFESVSLNIITNSKFSLSFIIRQNISEERVIYYYCYIEGNDIQGQKKPECKGAWFQLIDLGNSYPGKGNVRMQ